MGTPTFADSVELWFTLFARFWQHHTARPHRGHPCVYAQKALIVFFVVRQQRRLCRFKAPCRWLPRHAEMRQGCGLNAGPHRTTLSRRSTALYAVLPACIAFVGHDAEDRDPRFPSADLDTDNRRCKAQGPVWHQSDRQAARIPETFRPRDTEASWSTSGDHGWV